ncbi:MAG: NAD(P)H-dependent glycerol-3-phosphate dehydrogenase [Clostridiaceae bacterium]
MIEITVLGAGSFGTALSIILANKEYKIKIWDRNKEVVNGINEKHKNVKYLKEIKLPQNIVAYENIQEALCGSSYVVLAVPSKAVREVSNKIKDYIYKDAIVVNLAKGLEDKTYKTMSEVIEENLINNPVVVLSGPTHAEELAKSLPTVIVASSKDMQYAIKVQDLIMNDYFRVYTNPDLIAVEIGGAVKNIIALAAGISDGIGYGDNTKAALLTRGMHEIVRIGTSLGGKKETFSGLSGFGDLIVTCTSMHSRNRRAGILIGKGYSMEKTLEEIGMVVEGIDACKAFYNFKEIKNLDMPITDALYKVLFQGKDPKEAVFELMTRDKKAEYI